MANHLQRKNISFQQVLSALLNDTAPLPHAFLRQLSDLEAMDLAALESVWLRVNPSRRAELIESLADLAENDTLVMYDNIARMALTDPDPRVRATAVSMLDQDEDPRLGQVFIDMMRKDPAAEVRAESAGALGWLVYRGELEELPEELHHRIEDELLSVYNSSDEKIVRRGALESLGFSSRDEVPELLRNAYTSGDDDWLVSALFAMGRSADQSWEADVRRMLRHGNSDVQFEAVRAAGELALESTRRILLDLLEEEVQEFEVRAAVIWSLSQIGGEETRETLERLLEESDDEQEIKILEDALDNLTFTEEGEGFDLLEFDRLGQPDREIDDIEAYIASALDQDDIVDTTGNRTTDEDDEVTKNAGNKQNRRGKPGKDQ